MAMQNTVIAIQADYEVGRGWIRIPFVYDFKTTMEHLTDLDAKGLVESVVMEADSGQIVEITVHPQNWTGFIEFEDGDWFVYPVNDNRLCVERERTVYVKFIETESLERKIAELQAMVDEIATLKIV